MNSIQEIDNSVRNQIRTGDKTFHQWYQFVLGYPPHLVRYYVNKFCIQPGHIVLDPFCGTGTTNVECKKLDIESLGIEANPMAYFASRVKTCWEVDPNLVRESLHSVIGSASHSLERFALAEDLSSFIQMRNASPIDSEPTITEDQAAVLPRDFISPTPLRRVLILKECISRLEDEQIRDVLFLALASIVVNHAGNVAFGPEVYSTKPKKDINILETFYGFVERMISDLENKPNVNAEAKIVPGDSRNVLEYFSTLKGRVNFVITSPPYPNEKDYTRTTRLESVILGLISSKQHLRLLKEQLLRSNSRNVFVSDNDQDFVRDFASINRIAEEIERKRIDLRKTSGFEKLYHKIVRHYFGGMYRHLASMKGLLAPGARLAFVVGDQMSFFQTNIPTAQILGEIAASLGYELQEIELWRTRLATATKKQIDENVLILKNL